MEFSHETTMNTESGRITTLRPASNAGDMARELNGAIEQLHRQGGGTLLLTDGVFYTTSIYLRSNVSLYIDKTAEIRALSGCDDEEEREYSHREFSSDQSHTSQTPYITPENYMTKQDFGRWKSHKTEYRDGSSVGAEG